jgi:anti-anti-sigma factor
MGERFLVLHCGKAQCFDSVGLELVLALTRAASSQGARFVLAHLNADCSTTLRVTRLERAIEHYLTVEDAILAVQGRRA